MTENKNSQELIVLIDDDDGPVEELYEDALCLEGFKIERIRTAVTALEYIRQTNCHPVVWLVDLMMPIGDATLKVNGELLSKSTSLGLGMGRVLYREIRRRFPKAQVIMLTNMDTPEILDEIQNEMDENAFCEQKIVLSPSDLISLIKHRS